MMMKPRLVLLLLSLGVFLVGCASPLESHESEDTPVPLVVQAHTAGSDFVRIIAIEVRGPGIPVPIIVNLEVENGTARGTVYVPAGPERTFTGRAFDAEANLTHEGTVKTDVRPGSGSVQIPMFPRGVGVPIEVRVGAYAVEVAPEIGEVVVGGTLQITATVRDAEGRPVPGAQITWGSSNPAFARVDGSGQVAGVYPGTARVVANHRGMAAETIVTVVEYSPLPIVRITSPADEGVFEQGTMIVFEGAAVDAAGVPLTGPALFWESRVTGELGTGVTFSRSDLPVGGHVVTLRATDVEGRVGTASVTIHVVASPDPPVVTILSPEDGAVYEEGSAIRLEGEAFEAGGASLSGGALVWSSSVAGTLGTGDQLTVSDLAIGAHTISLTATGAGGRAATASVALTIIAAPDPPVLTRIAVAPGTASAQGPGKQRQFTATAYDQYEVVMPDVTFAWTSSNVCVATVDETGLAATKKAPGTAIIRASASGVTGSARYTVTHPAGPAPESLTGEWSVCDVFTGEFYMTLDLTHAPGSSIVSGSVTMADGTRRTLYNGRWQNGVFSVAWDLVVQGTDRQFSIVGAVPRHEDLLQGSYNDRFLLQTHDVNLVRIRIP
jgi:hypothetical protein